jgi:hypothetical protein
VDARPALGGQAPATLQRASDQIRTENDRSDQATHFAVAPLPLLQDATGAHAL